MNASEETELQGARLRSLLALAGRWSFGLRGFLKRITGLVRLPPEPPVPAIEDVGGRVPVTESFEAEAVAVNDMSGDV